MSTTLMRVHERVLQGEEINLSRIRHIDDHELVFLQLTVNQEAALRSEMDGVTLNSGLAVLRTLDKGLSFTVCEDRTGQLPKNMKLDDLFALAIPENGPPPQFSHTKFLLSKNSAAEAIQRRIDLKRNYPDLNGTQVHMLDEKLAVSPALRQDKNIVNELVQSIKHGSATPTDRHYQGSSPKLTR